MSSKRVRFENKSPSATPPDITYTDPVNCQWDTCMQQFSCITDLVQHIEKTHVLKGDMKDNVCLWRNCLLNMEPFKDQYMLIIHLRIHSGEKSHRCPYQGCDKILANLTNLKVHLQRHTGEMPYRCRIKGCNRSFVNSTECSRHEKTHSGEIFPCTYLGCDREYTDQTALEIHIVLKHLQVNKPPTKTSDKLHNCHPVQDLHDNRKVLKKKHHTHNNKRQHQPYKVDIQPTPLIATPPQQHPCHDHTGNKYLQLPFPMFSLPDINTIFDAQGFANYLPDNSYYYSDLQIQSYSLYQSPQLTDLSQHTYYPNGLLMPSQSSMTLSTNVHSHPQSTYKQYIPGHLPPYKDTQYMNYESPLTSTQQPIMSNLEDCFAIPTSSMFN